MLVQLEGAASVAVLVLAYVLVLQSMTAAVLVLARYIALQVRVLWLLLPVEDAPDPDQDQAPDRPRVVIGGGLRRWE